MSHQTGIHANEELRKVFSTSKEGSLRVIKVAIQNETLVLSEAIKDTKNNCWNHNYDKWIIPLAEENQPCYILYRLDSKNEFGYEWLFISWVPDTSPVREKMLYASTKSTLKQDFGKSRIKEEIHGTILADITLDGYNKYKKAAIVPAPLTNREEKLQLLKRSEIHTEYNLNSKHQTLGGVNFPVSDDAKQAILDMGKGLYEYLQLMLDMDEEVIHLVTAENISLSKLPSKIPDNSARYHLYNFKHTHEGDYMENIVFIYSMPGYNCSIKERMLYSSCKNPLTETIASLGIEIVKKLEIESGSELNNEYFYEEIHPTKNLHRPKFAKPKGPPGRGPKRLTKAQTTD